MTFVNHEVHDPFDFVYEFLADPIVLIASIILGLETKGGKWFMDTTLLKLPVFSKIVKEKNCATLIRSLSSLLSSGVPLTRSLRVGHWG